MTIADLENGTLTVPAGRQALSTMESDAGTVAVAERERRELQSAMMFAMANPRSELDAVKRVTHACGRPGLASQAIYSFRRGRENITGPSIVIAKEMARCWGNIRYGFNAVPATEGVIHIRCWAMDLESNTKTETEDRFEALIQRRTGRTGPDGKKLTEWVKPDERDLRELVNRRASFGIRNCLLNLLPSDVIDDALDVCRNTAKKAAAGDLQMRREDVLRGLVMAYDDLGVSRAMIEDKIGHGLDEIAPEELVDLRAVFKSIKDGQSTRAEHFETSRTGDMVPTDQEADATAKAEAAIEASKKKAAAKKKATTAVKAKPKAEPKPKEEAKPEPETEQPAEEPAADDHPPEPLAAVKPEVQEDDSQGTMEMVSAWASLGIPRKALEAEYGPLGELDEVTSHLAVALYNKIKGGAHPFNVLGSAAVAILGRGEA